MGRRRRREEEEEEEEEAKKGMELVWNAMILYGNYLGMDC